MTQEKPMPLLSDETIMGTCASDPDMSPFGVRDIYEQARQSDLAKIEALTKAGSKLKVLHMDNRDQEDPTLCTDVIAAIDEWIKAITPTPEP